MLGDGKGTRGWKRLGVVYSVTATSSTC